MRFACAALLLVALVHLAAPAADPATASPATTDHPGAPLAAGSQSLFSDAEWTHVQNQVQPSGQTTSSGVAGRAIMGLLVSVGLIVAVALVLAYAAKRWGGRRIMPGKGRHLVLIETVPLAFKRSVSLVRIGDQILVIGQGEHELHQLAILPASTLDLQSRAADQDPAAASDLPGSESNSAFASMLARLIGKKP